LFQEHTNKRIYRGSSLKDDGFKKHERLNSTISHPELVKLLKSKMGQDLQRLLGGASELRELMRITARGLNLKD
jgi:hypothetical protein